MPSVLCAIECTPKNVSDEGVQSMEVSALSMGGKLFTAIGCGLMGLSIRDDTKDG